MVGRHCGQAGDVLQRDGGAGLIASSPDKGTELIPDDRYPTTENGELRASNRPSVLCHWSCGTQKVEEGRGCCAVKLGVISDVHGDPISLELAWARLTMLGAERIVCAGDLVGYGPDPDGVVAFLTERRIDSVRGNHDRWALERPAGARDEFGGGAPARGRLLLFGTSRRISSFRRPGASGWWPTARPATTWTMSRADRTHPRSFAASSNWWTRSC